MFMSLCAYVYSCMWRANTDTRYFAQSRPYLMTRSHRTWSSADLARLCGQQESSHLCLPNAGITDVHSHVCLFFFSFFFHVGYRNLNLGLYASAAIILPTDPPPPKTEYLFKFNSVKYFFQIGKTYIHTNIFHLIILYFLPLQLNS